MKRLRATLLFAIGFSAAHIDAAVVPLAGRLDTRIRNVAFDADQVYRLQGVVGYAIDLIFASDEDCVGISGGDLDAVVLAANGHRLTIKPKLPVATNFTVLTTLRAYHIEYHVDEASTEPEIFAVQFTYAPLPSAAPTPAQQIDRALEEPRPVVNTNYWYCGALALEPVNAWDDGLHTHLTFSAHTEWPAIYLLNADGSESLLNFSVRDDTAVIHRLFERVILRRGKQVGCVFNRAAAQPQESARTGTVSPDVSRVMKATRR